MREKFLKMVMIFLNYFQDKIIEKAKENYVSIVYNKELKVEV